MVEKKLAVGYWVEYWDKDHQEFAGGNVLGIEGNPGGWIDVKIMIHSQQKRTIPDFLIHRTRGPHYSNAYEPYPFFSEEKAHG